MNTSFTVHAACYMHWVLPLATPELVPLGQHLPILSVLSSLQPLCHFLPLQVWLHQISHGIYFSMPDYVSFRTTDVADGNGSFSKAQRCSPGHSYHILYILVDTHRIAVVGIRWLWLQWSGVGVGGRMLMSLFLDYRAKAWLLGPITLLLAVWWNSPTVFHHGCTDFHAHHRCLRAFFPPCSLFIRCNVTSHCTEDLVFIPFTNEAGHFSDTCWSFVHIL